VGSKAQAPAPRPTLMSANAVRNLFHAGVCASYRNPRFIAGLRQAASLLSAPSILLVLRGVADVIVASFTSANSRYFVKEDGAR
jgi:hypothetical protein